QVERVARLVNTPISLLITGETGSGKEFFAKAVHSSSERRARPFVAVNCAAIPEHLIESELFGHLPGSFSGASPKGKRGLIAEADGGTLFLDEIGDMPLALQARLLRVLSEREVLPVGATRPVPVNIRVIAATHAPLEQLVLAGRFRDDLYYRLKGAHIQLPPLRERSDLGAMITRLLGGRSLTPAALQRLMSHPWPGNLRELRNVLDYAASICAEGVIDLDDLPELLASRLPARTDAVAASPDEGPEALLQALRAAHWNVSAVARDMGLSRMTLYRRMKRAGIVHRLS
ncbi:MAG: sigma 54-interacting transcriptional regulator, partial [Hydrogenophaga sp.]|uniref:sigma-54 interaction domain-containing protein n=2 Tax=Hydrogenophaga sp. TaxID=1904254 RepID=UPI002731523D